MTHIEWTTAQMALFAGVPVRDRSRGRAILTLSDINGQPYELPVTVSPDPPQHLGYLLHGGKGGWALYGGKPDSGDVPCYRIAVRKRGRRKSQWVRLDNIVAVRTGWAPNLSLEAALKESIAQRAKK